MPQECDQQVQNFGPSDPLLAKMREKLFKNTHFDCNCHRHVTENPTKKVRSIVYAAKGKIVRSGKTIRRFAQRRRRANRLPWQNRPPFCPVPA